MPDLKVNVKWVDHLRLLASNEKGHAIVLDAGKEVSLNQGPSPMELILMSVGGCMMMDMVSILGKMKENLTSLEMDISSTRREEHPRVFNKITVTIHSTGASKESVEKAFTLSKEKYCSVYAMLSPVVDIEYILKFEEV